VKIFRAYYSLPIPLQNVVISLYGYYLRRKRYGKSQKICCEILRENERLPNEGHKKRQLKSLKEILTHCQRNVPYYQELFKKLGFKPETSQTLEDLHRLPLLEKRNVLKNPEKFLARNFKKSDMVLEETSGTSGSPLKVYWDKKFYAWIYALYEQRMRGSAGVSMKDRRANLTGKVLVPANQKKPPFWRYNIAEKQLYMSSYHLSESNIPYYVKALKKFKPRFIIGYPASIYPIAKYLINSKEEIPSLNAIISCSEYLSDETRSIVEEGFRCRVFNHYGSVEWVTAINECEEGNLHITPEFGIIEVLDSKGELVPRGQVGEMICTGLLNCAMPLIRYRTGDLGVFPEVDDGCGAGRSPCRHDHDGGDDPILTIPGHRTDADSRQDRIRQADIR